MARKGKLGKKPIAKVGPKQDISRSKGPAKDASRDGEAAKKGVGQGEGAKKGAGEAIANLGGFIFMCNSSTKADCFKYRVFGLNEGRKKLVEQVQKGMRLFLFDVDLRLLYGIYRAASAGSYKLENDAFGGSFPWQVRFSIQKDCLPLSEDLFKAAIKENYLDKRRFKVELTTEQVHRLVKLFRPLPEGSGRSPPRPRITAADAFDAHKAKLPRYREVDMYVQDRDSLGRLPPRSINYTPSDGFLATPSDHFLAKKQAPYAQDLTRYAHLYSSDERRVLDMNTQDIPPRASHESIYASDDLYPGREIRLQQGLAHNNLTGVGSVLSRPSLAPTSLSAYSGASLRPLSDLHLPRVRDDVYSVNALGADVDSVYRSRLQVPDVRGDILDRRVSVLDPLTESLAYSGGLSGEVLRGKSLIDSYATGYGALHRSESGGGLLSGITGASGISYRGELLPQSRYYGSGGL